MLLACAPDYLLFDPWSGTEYLVGPLRRGVFHSPVIRRQIEDAFLGQGDGRQGRLQKIKKGVPPSRLCPVGTAILHVSPVILIEVLGSLVIATRRNRPKARPQAVR